MKVNIGYNTNNFNTYRNTKNISPKEDKEINVILDSIEISNESKNELEVYSNLNTDTNKDNDFKRAIYLHYKKDRTLADAEEEHSIRKVNPDLDAALYAVDKADAIKSINEIRAILYKIASGEKLTDEEREIINN